MAIAGFDYKQFAKELSQEALQVIPNDIQGQDRQFIVNIVLKFCELSGGALNDDPNIDFDASKASLITQFIGEWTFHKAIDLIHSSIPANYRESILQKVAFTVFEISKQTVKNNVPQDQMIMIVEAQVKKSFQEALDDFKRRGIISAEIVDQAKTLSNIDEMAKQAAMEQNSVQGGNIDAYAEGVSSSVPLPINNKILKLATFAIILKKIPQEKVSNMLEKFDEKDAKIISQYLKMPNLEDQLDGQVVLQCLKEIKLNLPKTIDSDSRVIVRNFTRLIRKSNNKRILDLISKERSNVRQLILDIIDRKTFDFSNFLTLTIYQYLGQKLR